jgi:hypothetical protein
MIRRGWGSRRGGWGHASSSPDFNGRIFRVRQQEAAMAQWPAGTTEETFEGTGGLEIFYRSLRPQGQPRAVVVICHGVNSHSG